MENKLLEWVEEKCIEVQRICESYEVYRKLLQEKVNQLQILYVQYSAFYNESIAETVRNMNDCYSRYSQGKRDISQVCHVLGGKYLEIFNQYFGEEDGGENNDA